MHRSCSKWPNGRSRSLSQSSGCVSGHAAHDLYERRHVLRSSTCLYARPCWPFHLVSLFAHGAAQPGWRRAGRRPQAHLPKTVRALLRFADVTLLPPPGGGSHIHASAPVYTYETKTIPTFSAYDPLPPALLLVANVSPLDVDDGGAGSGAIVPGCRRGERGRQLLVPKRHQLCRARTGRAWDRR